MELLVPFWDDDVSSKPLLPAFTVAELPPSVAGVWDAMAADAESLCGSVPPDWFVVALDDGMDESELEVALAFELFCAELVLE